MSAVAPVSAALEAVRIEHMGKTFPSGVRALDDVSITVGEGEFLVVLGLSGSGKSTLLRCINRLIDPSEGRVFIFGTEMTALAGSTLREKRRQIGMIFQQFNLVKRHSVLDNVLSGALGRGHTMRSLFLSFAPDEVAFARACLQRVGLADRAGERADRLSGGQQQRVAISRALMQQPRIILADEPVASLDPALRHSVMRHIEALNREEGMTVICSLHDIDLVRRYASRIVALKAGRVVWEGLPENLDPSTFRAIYGEDAEPASNSSVEEEP
jgi:phosphonate transport system ATP-binding protein